MIKNRQDYINYRFKRAEESLGDALILVEKKRWNAVINRLYYASYYAVSALLLQKKVETKSHDGTRRQFGNLIIKENLLEKRRGKLYTKLFDSRHKGDYGDFFDFDESAVAPLIPQVREFLAEVKELIDQEQASV